MCGDGAASCQHDMLLLVVCYEEHVLRGNDVSRDCNHMYVASPSLSMNKVTRQAVSSAPTGIYAISMPLFLAPEFALSSGLASGLLE